MKKVKRISVKVLAFLMMTMLASASILAAEVTELTEDVPIAAEEAAVDDLNVNVADVTDDTDTENSIDDEAGYEDIMDLAVVAPVPPIQSILVNQSWVSAVQNGGLESVEGMIFVRFQDAPFPYGDSMAIPANSELVTITGLDTSQLGEQEVTVSLLGMTATVRAWVRPPDPEPPTPGEVQSISFWAWGNSAFASGSLPGVFQGQTPEFRIALYDGPFAPWYWDPEGLWGVHPTGNLIDTIVPTADMISGFNPYQLGVQTVTATYQGITATTEVYVYPSMPHESWEYYGFGRRSPLGGGYFFFGDFNSFIVQGDSIGNLNVYMKFLYLDRGVPSAPHDVLIPVSETTAGMTITGVDTTLVGQQDMTVTFAGVTDTLRIVVVANPNFVPDTGGDDSDNGDDPGNDTDNGNGDDSDDIDDSTNVLVLHDVATGITLEATPGVLPAGTRLVVNHIDSADAFNATIENALGANYSRSTSHRITLLDANGNRIQPAGYVTLSVPIPGDYNRNLLSKYYVSATGRLTGFTHTISADGSMLRFNTNHFSVYTLAERVATGAESSVITAPQTGDIFTLGRMYALLSINLFTLSGILAYKGIRPKVRRINNTVR
jgi:hypothetical protein